MNKSSDQQLFQQLAQLLFEKKGLSTINSNVSKGGFGSVIFVEDKSSKQKYAVKAQSIINSLNGQQDESKLLFCKQESSILECAKHKNVVEYHSDYVIGLYHFLQMKLCECSLDDWIQKRGNKKISQKMFFHFLHQILDGIEHLHSQNYVLRDLSVKNILISTDGVIKLCDFGLAQQVDKQQFLASQIQSYNPKGVFIYFPPELIDQIENKNEKFTQSKSGDIWAFGMCLSLLGGITFLQAAQFNQQGAQIKDAPLLDKFCNSLIKYILNPNPKQRPTISQIRKYIYDDLNQEELVGLENLLITQIPNLSIQNDDLNLLKLVEQDNILISQNQNLSIDIQQKLQKYTKRRVILLEHFYFYMPELKTELLNIGLKDLSSHDLLKLNPKKINLEEIFRKAKELIIKKKIGMTKSVTDNMMSIPSKVQVSYDNNSISQHVADSLLRLFTVENSKIPVYNFLNSTLDTLDEELISVLIEFYKMFILSIYIYDDRYISVIQPDQKITILYGGMSIDSEYFDEFIKVGQKIIFPCINTFCTQKGKALQLLQFNLIDDTTTLILFELSYKTDNTFFPNRPKNIGQVSIFPNDDEYILQPFSTFIIQSQTKMISFDKVVQVIQISAQ